MAQSPSDHADEMPLNRKLQAISSYKQATSLEFHVCVLLFMHRVLPRTIVTIYITLGYNFMTLDS